MAKPKKFELESPARILDEETRKHSPPPTRAYAMPKPAELFPQKKSATCWVVAEKCISATTTCCLRGLPTFYTQKALNDLAKIIGHIVEDGAEAASRFGTSLLDHVDLLGRFPRMGSPHPRKIERPEARSQPDLDLFTEFAKGSA